MNLSVIHNPRVPYDLLSPVFEHLEDDKVSLCAISLASRVFREEAQRILYRDVTALKKYTAHVKFLCTVAASPTRLALCVHAYSLSWNIGRPTDEEMMKMLPYVVENGLKAMCHLKELTTSVADSTFYNHPAYFQVLSAFTFRLERFEWGELQVYADELFDRVLVHQPFLRHLGLPYFSSFQDEHHIVPSTACPHLISMEASWSMIMAFLPGHHILKLILCPTDWVTDSIDRSFVSELKHVEYLSIPLARLRKTNQSGLETLRRMSSLHTLEIYGFVHFDGNEGVLISLEMPELVSIVSQLPTLQRLILSVPSQENIQQDNMELTHNIFTELGENLRHIDIWDDEDSYSRYINSQETVRKIRREEPIPFWL